MNKRMEEAEMRGMKEAKKKKKRNSVMRKQKWRD